MAFQCRRVVTGHTDDGKSTVLYDSSMELIARDVPNAGTQNEGRTGVASRVMWTTHGFPVDNDDPSDTATREVSLSDSDGTVFRVVRFAPGVTPRNHRTDSIDYAVVISGSIEMELDDATVRLAAGDVLVQRGTIHNWVNRGTEACVVAFVLIGANPATANGVTLPATG